MKVTNFRLDQCRQTVRLKVKVKGGEPQDAVIRMAHQDPEGLNARPVGARVHFNGQWHETKDVEVLEILPWLSDGSDC